MTLLGLDHASLERGQLVELMTVEQDVDAVVTIEALEILFIAFDDSVNQRCGMEEHANIAAPFTTDIFLWDGPKRGQTLQFHPAT